MAANITEIDDQMITQAITGVADDIYFLAYGQSVIK
jgi:hypothetical protein